MKIAFIVIVWLKVQWYTTFIPFFDATEQMKIICQYPTRIITSTFIFLVFAITNFLKVRCFNIPKSLNNEDFCVFGQNLGRFWCFYCISDDFGLIPGLIFANWGNSRLKFTNFLAKIVLTRGVWKVEYHGNENSNFWAKLTSPRPL